MNRSSFLPFPAKDIPCFCYKCHINYIDSKHFDSSTSIENQSLYTENYCGNDFFRSTDDLSDSFQFFSTIRKFPSDMYENLDLFKEFELLGIAPKNETASEHGDDCNSIQFMEDENSCLFQNVTKKNSLNNDVNVMKLTDNFNFSKMFQETKTSPSNNACGNENVKFSYLKISKSDSCLKLKTKHVDKAFKNRPNTADRAMKISFQRDHRISLDGNSKDHSLLSPQELSPVLQSEEHGDSKTFFHEQVLQKNCPTSDVLTIFLGNENSNKTIENNELRETVEILLPDSSNSYIQKKNTLLSRSVCDSECVCISKSNASQSNSGGTKSSKINRSQLESIEKRTSVDVYGGLVSSTNPDTAGTYTNRINNYCQSFSYSEDETKPLVIKEIYRPLTFLKSKNLKAETSPLNKNKSERDTKTAAEYFKTRTVRKLTEEHTHNGVTYKINKKPKTCHNCKNYEVDSKSFCQDTLEDNISILINKRKSNRESYSRMKQNSTKIKKLASSLSLSYAELNNSSSSKTINLSKSQLISPDKSKNVFYGYYPLKEQRIDFKHPQEVDNKSERRNVDRKLVFETEDVSITNPQRKFKTIISRKLCLVKRRKCFLKTRNETVTKILPQIRSTHYKKIKIRKDNIITSPLTSCTCGLSYDVKFV